jgi:N-acetyl-gamma-glutamyl-phosphate reductase
MHTEPTADALRAALASFYAGSRIVTVAPGETPGELLLRRDAAPDDGMRLHVFGNEGGWNARLVAALDNLGKGASGAAVQSLNLMCGLDETAGLRVRA